MFSKLLFHQFACVCSSCSVIELFQPLKTLNIKTKTDVFNSAVKLGVLAWGSMGIDWLSEPDSSGHSKSCRFWHFDFSFQPGFRLLLGLHLLHFSLQDVH